MGFKFSNTTYFVSFRFLTVPLLLVGFLGISFDVAVAALDIPNEGNITIEAPPSDSVPGGLQEIPEGTGGTPGTATMPPPLFSDAGWVDNCPNTLPHSSCEPDACVRTCRSNCDHSCDYWNCVDPASTSPFNLTFLPTVVQYMTARCERKIEDFEFRTLPITFDSGATGAATTIRSIPTFDVKLKQWACVTQRTHRTCPKACVFKDITDLNKPEIITPSGDTTRAYLLADDLICTATDFQCNNGRWPTPMYDHCYKQCQYRLTNSSGSATVYTINDSRRASNTQLYSYSMTTPSDSCVASRTTSTCTDGTWNTTPSTYDYCHEPCILGTTRIRHGGNGNFYTEYNSPTCSTTNFTCNYGSFTPTLGGSVSPVTYCNKQCLYKSNASASDQYQYHDYTIDAYLATSDSCGTARKTFKCNKGSWEETSPTPMAIGAGLAAGTAVYTECTNP